MLGHKALDANTPADFADVLRHIGLEKGEISSSTRQRMHTVMQWAWAHGHIGANPVGVVDQYNNEREHQGRWCYGKTPMCTFLDSLELTREKFIPH
jgi:hypothetical protein